MATNIEMSTFTAPDENGNPITFDIVDKQARNNISQLLEQIGDETLARENAIAEVKAQIVQQTPSYPEEGETVEEQLTWLNENGDTSKIYLLDDGYLYGYKYTEKVTGGYTNKAEPLPDNTTDTSKWVNGYKFGSDGSISAQSGTSLSNYISCTVGDVIGIKGVTLRENSDRIMVYGTRDNGEEYIGGEYWNRSHALYSVNVVDDVYTITLLEHDGTYATHDLRFAMPTPTDASDVIVTVNEEIVEGSVVKEYAWTNTNIKINDTNYDEEFVGLNKDINNLEVKVTTVENATKLLKDNVKTLETKVDNVGILEIPDYWKSHIEGKISTIKNLHNQFGRDCFSFVFMTDTHYPSNLGKISPVLGKKITEECNIKYVLHGGDAQTRSCHSTKDALLTENEEFETMFAPILDRMLFVEGNHDGSYGTVNGVTYAKQLTENEMYSEYYRRVGLIGDIHFSDNCNAYYLDDTANKVRYIGLNSQCVPNGASDVNTDGSAKYCKFRYVKFMQNQFDFLINEALVNGLTDKWSVIIFAHIYVWKDGGGDYDLMVDLLSAYQNKTTYTGSYGGDFGNDTVSINANFTNAKGTLVGYFSGHNHLDTVQTPSSAFKVITTRCDAKEENDSTLNAERVAGTTTEQSFDVFTVNKAERKIYATKIGAGSDRVIFY